MLARYSFLFIVLSLGFQLLALKNAKPVSPQMPIVSIHFDNGFICSGAYLNPRTILTSANCLDGFKVIAIKDSLDKVINVRVLKQINHPDFKWSFLWSRHDMGIIKTSDVNREYYYPVIGDENELNVYLAACGKHKEDGKRAGCSYGKNRGIQIWRYYISTGEVGVMPNDSGGIVMDSTAKKILGVIWGWNNTIGIHFNFSSSFSDESNRQFIKENL